MARRSPAFLSADFSEAAFNGFGSFGGGGTNLMAVLAVGGLLWALSVAGLTSASFETVAGTATGGVTEGCGLTS